jgi:hypothetical protein
MAKRDYKAEYQRRIQRGLERGFTRSQARGHPGKGQKLITEIKQEPVKKPTPLIPRTNRELVEAWGGIYLKRNKHGFHGGKFTTLDVAISFAGSLPKDAMFYFIQNGILVYQSPPPKPGELDERGERRTRSLSMLMDKSYLKGGGENEVRDKSAKLFDPFAISEFTVLWRKSV